MKKLIFSLIIPGTIVLITSSCGVGNTTKLVSTDSLSIAHGQILFNQNCSGCHGFHQNGIGPNLSGITETDSAEWLRRFIREPKKMIESGDVHEKKIYADYHSMMPSFTSITDDQIDQLISFLQTKRGTKKEKDDPFSIKDPIPEKIEASNIQVD